MIPPRDEDKNFEIAKPPYELSRNAFGSEDGSDFVPTGELARECGYESDHIGRLARENKVKAVRVGKKWFVSRSSLVLYRELAYEQKKNSALEHIVLSRKASHVFSRRPIVPSNLSEVAERIWASRINLTSSKNGGVRFILVALFLLSAIGFLWGKSATSFSKDGLYVHVSEGGKVEVQKNNNQKLDGSSYGIAGLLNILSYRLPGKLAQLDSKPLLDIEEVYERYDESIKNLKSKFGDSTYATLVPGVEFKSIPLDTIPTTITRFITSSSQDTIQAQIRQRILTLEDLIKEHGLLFATIDERFRNTVSVPQQPISFTGNSYNQGITTLNPDTLESNTVKTNTLTVSSGADIGADLKIGGHASASQYYGAGLIDCDAGSQTLNWDQTTGVFSCGVDAGAGVAEIKLEEGGLSVLSTATTLNFDSGKFAISASGSSEVSINLDWSSSGPASLSQDETVTGTWTFGSSPRGFLVSNSASVSANFEIGGYASVSSLFGTAFSGISDCSADGQTLNWNSSTGKFSCLSDASGTSSGSSFSGVEIAESDGSFSTHYGSISFETNMFRISAGSVASQSLVKLDWTNGPASRAADQTITGQWNFSAVGSSQFSGSLGVSKGITANAYQGGGLAECIASGKLLRYSAGQYSCATIADADVPNTITLDNITQITSRAVSDTTGDLAASRVDDGGVVATQALFSGAGSSAGFRAIADSDIPDNITASNYLTLSGGTLTGGLIGTGASFSIGEFINYASASKFFGAGLLDCDTATTSKLLWDSTTGRFSCGTDDDVPDVSDFAALVGGTGIDNNSGTLDFDATELAGLTFGDGSQSSLAYIFNLSAGDPTLTARNGGFSITGAASVSSNIEVAGNASASATFGSGLTDCDANGGQLLWNVSTGLFLCETLADADIPDTITVSSYLPLSGGTLIGSLFGTTASLSGTGEALVFKTDTLSTSTGALTINAFTLGGAVSGNAQNITGLAQLTVDNLRLDGNTFDSTTGGITIAPNSGLTNITGAASVSTNFEVSGYSSASQTFGSGLSACDSTTQKIIWQANGTFTCATDRNGSTALYADADIPFITIGNTSSLSFERALTGTTNQIVVSDNGANSSVVLSLPQDIHTGAAPTFAGLSLTNGSVSANFELTGASSELGLNAGGNIDTSIEIGGTASISGATTLRGVTYTWPSAQGSANSVLRNNGSGTLTWDVTKLVTSNSLDFDEIVNAMTLDADTTITGGAFALTFDHASASGIFEAGTGKFTTISRDSGALTIANNTSASLNFEVIGYASASKVFGAGLSDCDTSATSKLLWDATTGRFSCGTDESGSSSGTQIEIGASSPNSGLKVSSVSFDAGGFNITDGGGYGVVVLDYVNGPASRTADQTISGDWDFTNTGSHSAAGEWNFDSNTFVVDSGTNRIGIGTANLEAALEIVGLASISDDLRLNGNDIQGSDGSTRITFATTGPNLTFTGTASVSGTFEGAGTIRATTFTGDSGLTVQSGGANTLTLDTGGSSTISVGGTNATGVTIGRSGQTITLAGNLGAFTLAGAVTGSGSPNITGIGNLSVVNASGSGVFEAGTVKTNTLTADSGILTISISSSISQTFENTSGSIKASTFTGDGAVSILSGGSGNITITPADGTLTINDGATDQVGITGNASISATLEAATGKFTTISRDSGVITIANNASASLNFEIVGYASASKYFGGGLSTCGAGSVVLWNNGLFSCGPDQTGNSAVFNGIEVTNDLGASFTHISSLSFEPNNFNLTNTASSSLVRLDWANGPASRTANETITGLWRFTGASTQAVLLEAATASVSGTFTFGNGSAVGSINTSDWDISTAGILAGISGITTDGGYTQSGTSTNALTGLTTFSGGASSSTGFEITTGNLGINAGAATDTRLEIGGTASISGATTLRGITYTWPSADGAGVLNSNGSGTLSWAADDDTPESGDFTNLTGGLAIDNTTGTLDFDPTELINNRTWSDGSSDTSIVWTFNLSAGTDPTITFGNNNILFGQNASTTLDFESAGRIIAPQSSISIGEFTNYASASKYYGLAFASLAGTNGCAGTDDTLNYNSTTGVFSCGSDASGGGSGVQIEIGASNPDSGIKVSSVSFDAGAFNVTNPSGYAFIQLDYVNGPASRTFAETISGLWTFTGGASFSAASPVEISNTASVSNLKLGTALADGYVADALTVSGGTLGSNNISGTLTTTGLLTIGDNGDTVNFDTSTWDVAAGVFSGLAQLTVDNLDLNGNSFTSATGGITIAPNSALTNITGAASVSTNFEVAGYASASAFSLPDIDGGTLTDCEGTGNKLTWDLTTKKFNCEVDQTGGGGGAPLGIEIINSGESFGSHYGSVSFDAGMFTVSFGSPTASASLIKLDWTNGPASRSANEAVTGFWEFRNGASFSAGSNGVLFDLNSTGDFIINDNASPILTISDSGVFTFDSITLDSTTIGTSSGGLTIDSASTLTIADATSFSSTASISGTFEGAGTIKAPTFSGDGAVTLSSGGSSGLTLDSASGTVTLGSGDSLTIPGNGTIQGATGLTLSGSGADLNFSGGGTNTISASGTLQLGAVTLTGLVTANSQDITGVDDLTFANASGSARFELTGITSRLGINSGGSTEASLEVGGTSSVSGAVTFGSTLSIVSAITQTGTGASNSFAGSLNTTLGLHALTNVSAGGNFLGIGTGSNSFAGSLDISKGIRGLDITANGNLSFFGEIRPDGVTCANGEILKKTGTNDWDCATDATGGSATFKTEESGLTILSTTSILNFDGGKFTLTASGSTETILSFDWGSGGPASLSQNETVTGQWTFGNSASISTGFNFEVGGYASSSKTFGSGLTDCDDDKDNQQLQWTASGSNGGKFSCINGFDIQSVQVFTSTGTWTKPANVSTVSVEVWGGGAGGGVAGANASDGGGGAGGYSAGLVGVTGNVTVTVGATSTVGGAGNLSSFAAVRTLQGSGGATNSGVTGGAGGAASGGTINLSGQNGASTLSVDGAKGGEGGSSPLGGAGGAGGTAVAAGSTGMAGQAGSVPGGGGGGGSESAGAASTGAAGMVIVWAYSGVVNGGDLAEWYETEENVEMGDVVSFGEHTFDYLSDTGPRSISVLKKAATGEQIFGVVSQRPGLNIGKDLVGQASNPRPVALSGRVPVKVSTQGGVIRKGDLLTSSSVPGVAMRTDKASQIIGSAMEDYNASPDDIGSILVYINTGYSNGARVKRILQQEGVDTGEIPYEVDIGRVILSQMIQDKKNITKEVELSEIFTDRVVAGLEIISPRVITDTIVANILEPVEKDLTLKLNNDGKFVITAISSDSLPKASDGSDSPASDSFEPVITFDANGNAFFAGQLTANTINAEKISGLEIITKQLSVLSGEVASMSGVQDKTDIFENGTFGAFQAGQALITNALEVEGSSSFAGILFAKEITADKINSPAISTLTDSIFSLASQSDQLASVSNDFSIRIGGLEQFKDDLQNILGADGGLTVSGFVTLNGGLIVNQVSALGDALSLMSDTIFFGRPFFNADTGGFAIIPLGSQSVRISFEREYAEQPIVNVSIAFDRASDSAEFEKSIFTEDIRYIVTHKDTTGFDIVLSKPAPQNVPFNWISLAVRNPRTIIGTPAPTPILIENQIISVPGSEPDLGAPSGEVPIPSKQGSLPPEPSEELPSETATETPEQPMEEISSEPEQTIPETESLESENTIEIAPVLETVPEPAPAPPVSEAIGGE